MPLPNTNRSSQLNPSGVVLPIPTNLPGQGEKQGFMFRFQFECTKTSTTMTKHNRGTIHNQTKAHFFLVRWTRSQETSTNIQSTLLWEPAAPVVVADLFVCRDSDSLVERTKDTSEPTTTTFLEWKRTVRIVVPGKLIVIEVRIEYKCEPSEWIQSKVLYFSSEFYCPNTQISSLHSWQLIKCFAWRNTKSDQTNTKTKRNASNRNNLLEQDLSRLKCKHTRASKRKLENFQRLVWM